MKNWFFVSSFAILILNASGCASAPKVVKTMPVYSVPAPTNGLPQSPYQFSQEPAKRVIEDDGREYRAHVRELQRQRLAHERQLARIEQAAEEAVLAKERGVTLAPAQSAGQPQPATQAQSAPVQGPSVFSYTPATSYGYGYVPSGFNYSGGGYSYGYGGGYGYAPITQGTYRSSVRADWGPVRSGVLGKTFRWLTQSEDFPGLRHTGGPAVVTRTYTGGAQVVAGGGFTSGLNFRWGR